MVTLPQFNYSWYYRITGILPASLFETTNWVSFIYCQFCFLCLKPNNLIFAKSINYANLKGHHMINLVDYQAGLLTSNETFTQKPVPRRTEVCITHPGY